MNRRIWIAHRQYNQRARVSVKYDKFSKLWRVYQQKTEVILCTHLCMCNVEFRIGVVISGYIATFKEIRDLHDQQEHSENVVFDYDRVRHDGGNWVDQSGKIVEIADYVDMISTDSDKILAINTKKTIK